MAKMGITKALAAVALLAGIAVLPVQADHHANIVAAVANEARPADDVKRDGDRKPAEVLAFSGVKPGMTVVDINSGSGYYSEMLSYAVGAKGKVYAHNGPIYFDFVKNQVATRYTDRLPNVIQLAEGSENINVKEGSVDLAMIVLAYHDYYYLPKGGRSESADVAGVLSTIYKSLKKGGAFVVVDHVGPDGSGPEAGNTTHRIEPAFVMEQVTAAGFTYFGESSVLENAADDVGQSVFGKDIRGRTNRFIYKFVK
ncbi:MAG: class I SAM-dependent methyltransferase [Kordiimonadaceae bacterium]|nr:class I SAM-dependent methyltransferase [Kordiimonadaceae bacterium]